MYIDEATANNTSSALKDTTNLTNELNANAATSTPQSKKPRLTYKQFQEQYDQEDDDLCILKGTAEK